MLRKRSKYKKRCNATLEDDDKEFMLKVTNRVGCIPNYWASFITRSVSLGACNTTTQFEEVYRHIKDFVSVMSSYDPPCVEMKIPVDVNQQLIKFLKMSESLNYGGKLKLNISYTTEDFQEIVNVKAFDVETLWSSVGGFIGIFLGYSLLQIPEIFDAVWSTSWDRFTLISWMEYVCTVIMPCLFRKRKFHVVR